jgi:2'-5' RNA ligase
MSPIGSIDKIRTFIAVRIPADVRRRLAEVEAELKASGADVKWVPEENFHVTLKFLGYMEPDRLDVVKKAVESAIEGIGAFGVTLSGVGAFPKPSRPSVVWVGIGAGANELKALAEKAESALERAGFAREERPFSPHITIGRVKTPGSLDRLRDAIEGLREEYVGAFEVESVAVMKSDLRPTGPIYTQQAEFLLE